MAGIALCPREDNDCKYKEECLRYKQESTADSSFADFQSICCEENQFHYKWEMEGEKNG